MTNNVDIMEPNDPWKRRDSQQPPNIDDIFAELSGGMLGKDSDNNLLYFLLFALVGLWALSGIYVVKPAEEAVVLRAGKYNASYGPGLHWFARGIENVYVLNTNEIDNYSYSSEMLTEDENYARVALTVYYRIKDPKDFLFNVNDPVESLQGAVQSSLRQVIGHTHLEEILTFGKEKTRADAAKLIETILARYNTGIEVTDVKLQEATVPSQVLSAFDNVITAREEKAAKISKGEQYVKRVIPEATGKARRTIEAANAKQSRVLFDAKADVAKFLALLPEYNADPTIMQKRLYYQTMQRVLPRVSKVFSSAEKPVLFLSVPSSKEHLSQSMDTLNPEITTMIANKE